MNNDRKSHLKYVALACGGREKKPVNLFIVGAIVLTLVIAGFWSYKQWFRTSALFTGDTPESVYFQELSYSLSDEYAHTFTILPAWRGDKAVISKVLSSKGVDYLDMVKEHDFTKGKLIVAKHPLLSSYVCLLWSKKLYSYEDFIQLYEKGHLRQYPHFYPQYVLNHEIAHCIHNAMPSWNTGMSDIDLKERVSKIIHIYDQDISEKIFKSIDARSIHERYIREAFSDLYAIHKLRNQSSEVFLSVMDEHSIIRHKDASKGYFSHITYLHLILGISLLEQFKDLSSGDFAEKVIKIMREKSESGFLDYLIAGYIADTIHPSKYRVLNQEIFVKAKTAYDGTKNMSAEIRKIYVQSNELLP